MATDKTFTVVGVSKKDGVFKVRYANSIARAKVLAKTGHTDIFLIELDEAGQQEDCVDALLDVLAHENTLCEEAKEAVLCKARELGFIV